MVCRVLIDRCQSNGRGYAFVGVCTCLLHKYFVLAQYNSKYKQYHHLGYSTMTSPRWNKAPLCKRLCLENRTYPISFASRFSTRQEKTASQKGEMFFSYFTRFAFFFSLLVRISHTTQSTTHNAKHYSDRISTPIAVIQKERAFHTTSGLFAPNALSASHNGKFPNVRQNDPTEPTEGKKLFLH